MNVAGSSTEGQDLFDKLLDISAKYTSDIKWRDFSGIIQADTEGELDA